MQQFVRCGYLWATAAEPARSYTRKITTTITNWNWKKSAFFVLSFHFEQHPSAIKSKGCLYASHLEYLEPKRIFLINHFILIHEISQIKQHSMCREKSATSKKKNKSVACLRRFHAKFIRLLICWAECQIGIFLINETKNNNQVMWFICRAKIRVCRFINYTVWSSCCRLSPLVEAPAKSD